MNRLRFAPTGKIAAVIAEIIILIVGVNQRTPIGIPGS
jgi:hypothetical protein